MNDSSVDQPAAESLQYMQTVADELELENVAGALSVMDSDGGGIMIDPPRKPRTRSFSFDSEEDILSTDGDSLDEDYQLSTSSSSDEDIPKRGVTNSTVNPLTTNRKVPQTQGVKVGGMHPETTRSDQGKARKDEPTANSFADVLNDIFEDKPAIPVQSKLGPKPWLRRNPKPRNKYEVSKEPFVFKPKQVQAQMPQENLAPLSRPASSQPRPTVPDTKQQKAPPVSEPPIYDTPPSRGRLSSASSGNALSDNEKSVKYPSEADTGFGSNTSSNTSPHTSSNNLTRLPPGGDSREPSTESPMNNGSNAQELARAAIQALTLSKNILKGKEKESPKQKSPGREESSIYDEVPFSPVTSPVRATFPAQSTSTKNLYDDVPAPRGNNDPKRTVISVPVFKPPVDLIPPKSRPPMSRESLYDISRSNTKTPQNVTSDALQLMYQLFGKDLSENNRQMYGSSGGDQQQIYSRPPSAKSDKIDDGFPSRPSSRAGSIYSEWSDCTINIPDYPESEATTVARTQIEFPAFPQVGFPPPPQNRGPNFLENSQQNTNFSAQNRPIYNQNFPQAATNQNFPFPNDPARSQSGYPRNPNTYQTPNNNPMFSNPSQAPPAMFPLHNTNYMPHEIPNPRNPVFPPTGAYRPRHMDSQKGMYGRPPTHAFSPPRHWGGFSPRDFPHPHRHPADPYIDRRGRRHGRHFDSRVRGRSNSRSRRRQEYYSDEDSLSRSPSPVRRNDVMDTDVIAEKSYIDGYKAALKHAVLTFAQKEGMKKPTVPAMKEPIETKEEKIRRTLRRALSAGRIADLPDNIELGDIRKAFALPEKSLSEDELDSFDRDRDDDDFIIPARGRPLSRNGSLRRRRQNRRPRRYPSDDDVRPQRNYRPREEPSESDHDESCDCSECEEDFESMARNQRYHEGEVAAPPQPRSIPPRNPPPQRRRTDGSPEMKGLRQRYMDSFEQMPNTTRAPVRANHGRHPVEDGQGYDERYPQSGGQGYKGRHPQDGGQGYDDWYPPDGGQRFNGRYPPNGSQGFGGRLPQNGGPGYGDRPPQDGGQGYDNRFPPNGGQNYDDFRNRRANERRQFNYEDVRFDQPNGSQRFPNAGPQHQGYQGGYRGAPNFPQQRGPPQQGYEGDRRRVQFEY